jgi:hypothetical protein
MSVSSQAVNLRAHERFKGALNAGVAQGSVFRVGICVLRSAEKAGGVRTPVTQVSSQKRLCGNLVLLRPISRVVLDH